MTELADPWLLVLMPLPLLIAWLAPALARQGAALRVPATVGQKIALRQSATGEPRAISALKQYWLPTLVWALLVVAIAGPRQLTTTQALPTSGRDLVFAIDLSGSMVRTDFSLDGKTASRLDVVKKVAAEFVGRRGGDRVGLVLFGSKAYFATPLTFDVAAVVQAIEQAVIGISGRATNISDALGIALKRLSASHASSRVVILLSDGSNNAGAANPRGVAKLAKDMNVRIHTIALGPKSATEAPGERGVVDAATLQAMSDLSGGKMFRVRNTEDLIEVTSELDRLEATVSSGLAAEIYQELWLYPAIIAGLGCLFLGWRSSQ